MLEGCLSVEDWEGSQECPLWLFPLQGQGLLVLGTFRTTRVPMCTALSISALHQANKIQETTIVLVTPICKWEDGASGRLNKLSHCRVTKSKTRAGSRCAVCRRETDEVHCERQTQPYLLPLPRAQTGVINNSTLFPIEILKQPLNLPQHAMPRSHFPSLGILMKNEAICHLWVVIPNS